MKAIDKLREEGRAREKDMEKNFSSCLPFPSSSLTCQPLPLESFFFLLAPILFQFQLPNCSHYKIQVLCQLKKSKSLILFFFLVLNVLAKFLCSTIVTIDI